MTNFLLRSRTAVPLRRRQPLGPSSNNGATASICRLRSGPTFWVGMSMFSLVIFYVLAVVAVTRIHVFRSDSDGGAAAAASAAKPQRFGQKHHDLRKPFGDGVKPQALVVASDGGERPISEKEDNPDQHPTPQSILTAYLEPLNFDEWDIKPLPVRQRAKAENLRKVSYPRLNSCSKLTKQWPVDDTPADEDPFLPWIHDVFPTADGKYIQFVAQNKRRCKTGRNEKHIMKKMQPQVALFQHVPIQRVSTTTGGDGVSETRYKIVPYEKADPDGITTRFICRFKPSMQETLSVFNFDYDWTGFRKRYKAAFEKEGNGGIYSLHTSQLIFRCPVPAELQETVRTGASVQNDWASLFVDLIPIRTPPRYGNTNRYLAPWYAEFNDLDPNILFNPVLEWGDSHIVPQIEDSGRWENIPICKPSLMTYEGDEAASSVDLVSPADPPMTKKHKLVSCIWASAGYTTRGERFAVNDGQRRLVEWITHNKNIGFDHFYVYDNSGAFGDAKHSLKPIVDLFPGEVTYIPWPSKVCNNRPNNVDSPGDRSSQYAAESSCRLRFAPHVEWIGQFDIDEYLIPMGTHDTALSLLDELDKEDLRIISFGSWRAWPRYALIEKPVPIHDSHLCWSQDTCFDLKIPMSTTILQAYNCDRQPPGQKVEKMPAEKQIYRADYVLQHFVHYSAATVLSVLNRTEYKNAGFDWFRRPFPDPRQRFANELTEGLMVHTKAVALQDTSGWERVCRVDENGVKPYGMCRLGFPWPDGHNPDPQLLSGGNKDDTSMRELVSSRRNASEDGWIYNCYVNKKVEEVFVPQLEAALKERIHFFDIKAEDQQ